MPISVDSAQPEAQFIVPHVRLFAGRALVTRTTGLSCQVSEVVVPFIELAFDYGGVQVRANDERTRVFRAQSGRGALESVSRDLPSENRARSVLERLGAVDSTCIDTLSGPEGCDAEYLVSVDGDAQSYCAFTARALAQFRSLGWRVEIDEVYPFHLVEPEPVWYGSLRRSARQVGADPYRAKALSDAERDWFGLELGVVVDGVRVDLVPIVLELLEQVERAGGLEAFTGAAQATFAMPVSATKHLALPIDRLRSLLRVVAELYQGEGRRGLGFPEVRVPAIVGLDEEFRRAGGAIAWEEGSEAFERVPGRVKRARPYEPPRGLHAKLRPYQIEGVEFLQRLGNSGVGGILADEMGLGKTLQTIAYILTEKSEGRLSSPALIVGPTTLVGNWSRELAKFAPELRVVVLHGHERHALFDRVAKADVVVTTYPVLVRDEDRWASHPFSLVVLDEAQAIKNARSLARRALSRVVARQRLCLTGTPVENNLGELWSIFDWLAPGLLGDELAFRRFWRHPIERFMDADRLAALRDVVGPYVLRRLKRDVARELPPKTELSVPVELGGKQRELYEALRAAAHAEVRRAICARGLAASSVTILDALTKLRQVCCDPRLVALHAARSVRESAKLEALMKLVPEQLAAGHRILLFSQFTSMLALIAEGLEDSGISHLLLTGSTRDRQRVVDDFEEGHADVFLISLKAGGTGLNLTTADTVVHYDPWWNPAAQAQATDRAYRIGQNKPVFVYNLFVVGSVEERVLALQERKRWLSGSLLGDASQAGVVKTGSAPSAHSIAAALSDQGCPRSLPARSGAHALSEDEVDALLAPLEE
jgi:superfamily II DNA or RNA helicase